MQALKGAGDRHLEATGNAKFVTGFSHSFSGFLQLWVLWINFHCQKVTSFQKYALLILGNNVTKERGAEKMKKWKFSFVILVIILIFGIKGWNFPANAQDETDLLKIIDVLQKEKINITEWSLYAREKVDDFENLTEVKDYGKTLMGKFPDWQWEVENASGHWELKGTSPAKKGHEEFIKILAGRHGKPQTYIIYEIRGKSFTRESGQFIKDKWRMTAFDIFRGNPTIFSCVKGELSDNINTTLPKSIDRFLTLFKAEKTESIEEKNFISTSAYSPIFADSINSNEKEMNVQLGIRSEGLGAKTTLVVGTPIITIEY